MEEHVDRGKILRRVFALMQKTTDQGCTEEEAAAAASAAQRLIDQYELNEYEVHSGRTVSGLGYPVYTKALGFKYASGWRGQLSYSLSENMAILAYRRGDVSYYSGRESTVEAAAEIAERLVSFVHQQSKLYRSSIGGETKDRRSYAQGMAIRLCQRIRQSSDLSTDPRLPAIVSSQKDLIKTEMGLNIQNSRSRRIKANGSFMKGYEDGASVPLRAQTQQLR